MNCAKAYETCVKLGTAIFLLMVSLVCYAVADHFTHQAWLGIAGIVAIRLAIWMLFTWLLELPDHLFLVLRPEHGAKRLRLPTVRRVRAAQFPTEQCPKKRQEFHVHISEQDAPQRAGVLRLINIYRAVHGLPTQFAALAAWCERRLSIMALCAS